jgi:DNA-binding IclR family transcriptional regulator
MNESSVGTLSRGLDVLELFDASASELSQKEISEALGLPMPTVHRLTALLTERGWLDRDPLTRRLRLGLGVARLMPALMAGLRLPELARPHLVRFASTVHETVNVAILDGSEVVYLLSESSDRVLTSQVTVGTRLPAHCIALGKCLLAQLPEDVARTALGDEPYGRRTEHTQTTWAELAPDLATIRDTGLSVSEEEYEIGLVSLAVPVSWIEGPGTAAINVSLPATRATPEFRKELTRALRECADAIDRDMSLSGRER